jgi:glutathione peroxidase
MTTVFDFTAKTLSGEDASLARWRGRVLLIVNVASQCGFTPHYAGLQKLYETFEPQGLTVLGFPCNQFGAQEPGSEAEIGAFCTKNYGVSFPLFAKIEVNGPGAHPLYQFLKREKRGLFGSGAIKWNFTKFLCDRAGHVVARYAPTTKPDELETPIGKLL